MAATGKKKWHTGLSVKQYLLKGIIIIKSRKVSAHTHKTAKRILALS